MGVALRLSGLIRTVSALGAVLLVSSALVVADAARAPEAAHAATTTQVNPLTVNGGFTVYATQNASLGNSEFEGSLAVGGQLTMTQGAGYQFAHVIAGTGAYNLPTVDGDPTRLLIGSYSSAASNVGQIEVTSNGATQPSQIGDFKVVQRGAPFTTVQRASWVRYGLSANPNGPPLVDAESQPYSATTTTPPATSDGNGSIYTYVTGADTQGVVASYVEANEQANADQVEQCMANIADPTTDLGHQVTVSQNLGDRVVLGPLASDQPNILDYSLVAGASLLQFSDGTPGPNNPLIIRVPAGTTNIHGISIDPEGTYAPYVVWDLSQLSGAVSLTTSGRGDGSVFAPGVDLTISAQPWDGQVYAHSYTMNGGEVHSYMFAGTIPCTTADDTGTFTVSKALDGVDSSGLAPGTTFTVDYDATLPDGTQENGTLTLSPDGTAVGPDADFPFGTSISVTEVAPDDSVLLDPGLAWSSPTWSGDTTFTIDATHPSISLIVTNHATTAPAAFSVTKTITGTGAQDVPSGTVFPLQYRVNDGDWVDLNVSPGRPVTVQDGLVAGDTVTIREMTDQMPAVDGITWGTPSWSLEGGDLVDNGDGSVSFVLVANQALQLTLTNTATSVGSILFAKSVVGDAASQVPADTEYPLIYSVNGGPEITVTVPAGQAITVSDVAAGSTITIREGDLPDVPGVSGGVAGWTIDGVPATPDADGNVTFTVQGGETIGLLLTNTANGFGSFVGTKTVTGDAASSVPADTAFPIEYRVADNAVRTTSITAGVPVTIENMPTGIEVSVREGALPSIPGVVWGVPTWTVNGQSVAPDADGWVTFTAQTGTQVAIGLENHATASGGSDGEFDVTKTVTGSGASAVPPDTSFTVTYVVQGGEAHTLRLTAEHTQKVTGIAPGTVVTFTESGPPPVVGVTWGSPAWSVNGTKVSDPTVTVGASEVVTIGLTNTATTTGGLANTGSESVVALLWALAAMTIGTAAVALARLRRRRGA
ncbi:MAG TPA: DUF5979 domain-containing protein [Humibacter sp.]|nr:DUF5979 domain-containing protein [Humibacter sp.]